MNSVVVTKSANTLSLNNGAVLPVRNQWAVLSDGSYTLGFRAHHLKIGSPEAIEQTSQAFQVQCTVVSIEVTGSETFLHLRYGELIWVAITPGLQKMTAGDAVDVWLDVAQLFLFDDVGFLVADGDGVI
jgi:glycerol transport system ATP-binding protein